MLPRTLSWLKRIGGVTAEKSGGLGVAAKGRVGSSGRLKLSWLPCATFCPLPTDHDDSGAVPATVHRDQ
jgi:hypothetical protein